MLKLTSFNMNNPSETPDKLQMLVTSVNSVDDFHQKFIENKENGQFPRYQINNYVKGEAVVIEYQHESSNFAQPCYQITEQ